MSARKCAYIRQRKGRTLWRLFGSGSYGDAEFGIRDLVRDEQERFAGKRVQWEYKAL